MNHWLWAAVLGVAAVAGVRLSFGASQGRRRQRWFRRQRHHAAPPAVERALGQQFDMSPSALRFPLSGCQLGQSVCLQCLEVDHCILHRLRELGLTPGVELSVVQDSGGPLLVSVRGSRIALGRDLADNLYVIAAGHIPVPAVDLPDEPSST